MLKAQQFFLSLCLLLSTSSFAFLSVVSPYIEIQNLTGQAIHQLYLSPENVEDWENDIMDKDVLPHGELMRINLKGYDTKNFDIRIVDEDGDDYQKFNIHVEQQTIIFTPSDRSSRTRK